MKVLIFGGYGSVGTAVTLDLVTSPDIEQIIIAGRRLNKGQTLVTKINSNKVFAERFDLDGDQNLTGLLGRVDMVINAASSAANIKILKAALSTHTHYMDISGMFSPPEEAFAFHDQFVEAGLTAIIRMGNAPGFSNIMAMNLSRQVHKVEEIHIRCGTRRGPDFKGFNLSPRVQLEEFTANPIIYDNGKFKELTPLAGRKLHRFSDPIGDVEGFYAVHSEVYLLSRSIPEAKKITYWVAFPEETINKMDALINWGLTSEKPISVKGMMISPREFIDTFLDGVETVSGYFEEYKALEIEVIGQREGAQVKLINEILVSSNRELELITSAYWTGIPISVACQMIARGEITRPGVFSPETIFDADHFFAAMAPKGIVVRDISP